MKSTWFGLLLGLLILQSVEGFSPPQHHRRSVRTRGMSADGPAATATVSRTTTALGAKPQRLAENVDGVVYVNDRVSYVCSIQISFALNAFAKSLVVSHRVGACFCYSAYIPKHYWAHTRSASTVRPVPHLHRKPFNGTTVSFNTWCTSNRKLKRNWPRHERHWPLVPWPPFAWKA